MRRPAPFVLLDDATPGAPPARLYRDPVEVLTAHTAADVPALLARLRDAGTHAAGFLAYDAAPGIDPVLVVPGGPPSAAPLAWFGLFDRWEPVDAAAWLPDPRGAWVGTPRPGIDRAGYDAAFARVAEWIRAGDLYQANLSFRAAVPWAGDPLALYAQLRARSGAGYGAVVATGTDTILSLSPELFFTLDDDRLTARPMKGTLARTPDGGADPATLRDDPKQRAENLMIVDLLRNDLSRVAVPGSVAVPSLFTVESFPTVHQLTSTVTARLAPGLSAVDVLAAAFPCGSITGAPKRRAAEVIAAVEAAPRGLYTGAIGRIDARTGDAAFNIAIRTLTLPADGGPATLGLGSGVVADSDVGGEWDECLAKAAFLGDGTAPFDLLETMLFDPDAGLVRLDAHLARLGASAAAFGIRWDRHAVRNELQAATFRLRAAARVRLLLSRHGHVAVEIAPLGGMQAPLAVRIAALPVPQDDLRLRHKTAARAFYDDARTAAGTAEVVFARPDGLLTEGSFTTLFVRRADRLLTPPAARGLLPGLLRAELLAAGAAVEADLRAEDLRDGFLLGNAVRGLMRAHLAL